MIEVIAVVLVVILIGYMMVKKVNGAAALFTGGILLFVISALLGHSGFGSFEIESSGSRFYDILLYIDEIFKDNLTGSGLIIMALFGYSALMGVIGANEVAIDLLSRPLLRIGSRGRLFMIPLLYYVCSVMSLAVPSAASLAVLLMATLFPALVGAGMSPLGVGAVIATSAAIMPTPLAADAIASSKALGIDLGTYVFSYNARIALPATLVIGIAHMFWQQYCDKKDGFVPATPGSAPSLAEDSTKDEPSAPSFYALLPVLPLLLALVIYVLNMVGAVSFTVELLPITIVSVVVTLIVDMITRRTLFSAVDNLKEFFAGMGRGLAGVVSLLISAAILVNAITQLGVIDKLISFATGLSGGGVIILILFVLIVTLLAVLTGSGLAAFFSLLGIVPGLASSTGLPGYMFTIPMHHAANLAKNLSPVAAVILVISGAMKVNPVQLIRRTSVPVVVGIVTSVALSLLLLS